MDVDVWWLLADFVFREPHWSAGSRHSGAQRSAEEAEKRRPKKSADQRRAQTSAEERRGARRGAQRSAEERRTKRSAEEHRGAQRSAEGERRAESSGGCSNHQLSHI